MSDLLARYKAARFHWIPGADGREYRVNRPSLEDLAEDLRSLRKAEVLAACVTDWRGFVETDFVPDGNPEKPAVFSRELFQMWIADQRDELPALMGAVMKLAFDRSEEKKDFLKKSD